VLTYNSHLTKKLWKWRQHEFSPLCEPQISNHYYHHHHHLSQVSFSLALLLNHWCTPPLVQVSDCITFLIMCDVPSTAILCTESTECFPVIVSRYFYSPLVTIPFSQWLSIWGNISYSTFAEFLHLECFYLSRFKLLRLAYWPEPVCLPVHLHSTVLLYLHVHIPP
jgi:hypothetical protein